MLSNIVKQLYDNSDAERKGVYIKYEEGGGQRVLQIFQKKVCSPGDHRPKYFMAPPINFSF